MNSSTTSRKPVFHAALLALPLVTLSAPVLHAQAHVATGDATVRSQLCVGTSCPDDPTSTFLSASASSVRISGTSTRLDFEDTSSPGFPTNDWALLINDASASGNEYFSVADVTSGSSPFRIDAGARDNALYVATDGRVGFGTTLPEASLHLEDGSFAALRLHRNTSGGGNDSEWTLGAGNAGFSIKDEVSGRTPFIVEATAPTYSLTVSGTTGFVGVGRDRPDSPLHVGRRDGQARIIVENDAVSPSAVREMFAMKNNGGSYFTLANTAASTEWYFVHENNAPNRFLINHSDGGVQMALTRTGDMTLSGELFTAGSCAAGCDRVFDEDYPLPTIPEQAAMMRAQKHLPNVGPTAEEGPFNITAMTGGMLNELEKAHLYIAQLHEEQTAMQTQIAELKAMVAELAEAR
ncbi:hypothetical protein ACN2XU_01115 [Primorskyibacter sp. 2E107]|uniref:hypothetical protein n=1 Tax=Primorskyibacter sp. 2E107 TaxID=3403458 RepID=UPI003AF414EE